MCAREQDWNLSQGFADLAAKVLQARRRLLTVSTLAYQWLREREHQR